MIKLVKLKSYMCKPAVGVVNAPLTIPQKRVVRSQDRPQAK